MMFDTDRQPVLNYLIHQAPVLFLILDQQGIIRQINRFGSRQLGPDTAGKAFQDIIIDFHHIFRLDHAAACSDTAHLLNFDTTTGDIQTYHCHFYSSREHILVFGHPDLNEIAFLSSQLLEVNQELNNLTRELNKKNTELANQRAAVAERNRLLETDLRSAAVIQKSLLPVGGPFLRDSRFAYRFKPCDNVGGDIFHIFPLPGNKLGMYMLDVSGHGTPAAMVSVCVHQRMLPLSGLVADLSKSPPRVLSPEEVLDALDREFPFERFETFFTICYAVLDPADGCMSCSNAAHPPPVIIDPRGNVTVLERSGGIIGLDRFSAFGQNDTALTPGSRLVMVTDGILDHGPGAAENFGFKRYLASLQKSAGFSLDEQLGAVMADVEAFAGSLAARDDMTLFGLEYNPPAV